MTESIFIYMLLIHFLADFGLQTEDQALGKGVGLKFFNKQLFFHVGVYSLIWLIAGMGILSYHSRFIPFAVITFIFHYLTDWCTSRIGKPYWDKKDLHNGFIIVGFDQMLHYLQLYYTFKLLLP